MRIERAVSPYHLRIGEVETHVLCYHTVVRHAAVSSNLPFMFTLHYQGTGQTKFRKLLHKVYPPVGAWPFNASDAASCSSDAERALVVRVERP